MNYIFHGKKKSSCPLKQNLYQLTDLGIYTFIHTVSGTIRQASAELFLPHPIFTYLLTHLLNCLFTQSNKAGLLIPDDESVWVSLTLSVKLKGFGSSPPVFVRQALGRVLHHHGGYYCELVPHFPHVKKFPE